MRLIIVGSVLLALPLLALPPVNRPVNAWLREENARWPRRTATRDAAPPEGGDRLLVPDLPADLPQPRRSQPRAAQERPPVAALQEQLRQLGAEDLQLRVEAGDYRWHCRVALPGNSVYSRTFEGQGADPRAAIEVLLDKVRQWRLAGGNEMVR